MREHYYTVLVKDNVRLRLVLDYRKKHLDLLLRGGEEEEEEEEDVPLPNDRALPAIASCVHFQTAWFKLRA